MNTAELIVIGCSSGGMAALAMVLSQLPRAFNIPIAIVQHRYRKSNDALPDYLRRHTAIDVVDATDKQPICSGVAYLAPANYHLLVSRGQFSLSIDAPVSYSRPSIDILFESAADAYGAGVTGVILTGANADGACGVQEIKKRGGYVVVQDPDTAEAPAMPRAAIEAALVDRILPLEQIGLFLAQLAANQ